MQFIYTFDENGYLTGVSTPFVDPVRGETAAINEAVATTDQPPAYTAATHIPRRVNGKWIVEELARPKPVYETIDVAQERKKVALGLFRHKEESVPIRVNDLVVNASTHDLSIISTMVRIMEKTNRPTISFKAVNKIEAIDINRLRRIETAAFNHVQACFDAEARHATNINKLETVEEVAAYDISTNWPSTENV